MSNDILFRPLVVWPHNPTPAYQRIAWPGSTKLTVTKALDSLRQQLRLLGCHGDAFIEVDLEERHIRQDGQLRADASPRDARCIVYAAHARLGDLRWACDGYRKLPENIRAIAMTIQNLRAIERYRCVRDAQQFRGFKALPAQASATLSLVGALNTLARYAPRLDVATGDRAAFQSAVRAAKAASHPDRHEGERTAWDAVERAVVVLAPIRWRSA